MTTIAASVDAGVMAADSRCLVYDKDGPTHAYSSTKLLRARGAILGGAGLTEDIDAFFAWWQGDRRRRRPKVKEAFQALVLTRTKLLAFDDNSAEETTRDGFMAIGTGAGLALAALTTMRRLNAPEDPRLAVEVACLHDPFSAAPIDFLTWKKELR